MLKAVTVWRNPKTGLYHPTSDLGIRYVGDLCIDPCCGSGTFAEAAYRESRRFIVIDREPDAIAIVRKRMQAAMDELEEWHPHMMKRDCTPHRICYIDMSDIPRNEYGEVKWFDFWDNGDSYIVLGDSIAVMRTMPHCLADLIYADPPFNAGRDFRDKKTGIGFSDIWHWDDDAEARLIELERIVESDMPRQIYDSIAALPVHPPEPPSKRKKKKANKSIPQVDILVDMIRLSHKTMGGDMASYLTWTALLLLESHRICGGIDHITSPFWSPIEQQWARAR